MQLSGGKCMTAIRLVLAIGDPVLLGHISAILSKDGAFNIIPSVASSELFGRNLHANPDILLFDSALLKEHPLSKVIRSLQVKSPGTRILCLLHDSGKDEDLIVDIKAGIRGFLKVTDPPSVMIKAIHAVFDGEIWAERRILEKAIAKPAVSPEMLLSHVPGLLPLTSREMEMLTLVVQGASNKEIADRSSISERTVKTHLYRVYRKLNVKSRTKAIALLSHS